MAYENLKCEFLLACGRRFAESDERLEALAGRLSDEQANWQPAPDRWSAAQCVEHLNASAGLYFGAMEEAIRRGRERGWTGTAPYGRGTLLGRLLLSLVDPANTKKVKAPAIFHPAASELDFAAVCDAFRAANRRFGELMPQADGLDLARIRLPSPVTRLIRLSLAQAFELHSLHEPRHLAQAERVTRLEGFPGPT